MSRIRRAALGVATFAVLAVPFAAHPQPSIQTVGVVRSAICYSGNFCGFPGDPEKIDVLGFEFTGVMKAAGRLFVGEFFLGGTVGHWVSPKAMWLEPMTLSGNSPTGTVSGSCDGTMVLTLIGARAGLFCSVTIDGASGTTPLWLNMASYIPPGVILGSDGPACVCSYYAGLYLRSKPLSV